MATTPSRVSSRPSPRASYKSLPLNRIEHYLIGRHCSHNNCYIQVSHAATIQDIHEALNRVPRAHFSVQTLASQSRPQSGHKAQLTAKPSSYRCKALQQLLLTLPNSPAYNLPQAPQSPHPTPAGENLQPMATKIPPSTGPANLPVPIKPILGIRWLLAVLELQQNTAWDAVPTRPWLTYLTHCLTPFSTGHYDQGRHNHFIHHRATPPDT